MDEIVWLAVAYDVEVRFEHIESVCIVVVYLCAG